MGKIRRGGFVFITWIGDHGHHVHVYRDGRLVVRWNLDEGRPMEGRAKRRIVRLIMELKKEGRL
ncbi:MAG: hypothetical protein V1798_03045 [Pseudomonadota bacterium]